VQETYGPNRVRLHHDDLVIGGLNKSDAQPVSLGENVPRGASLGINADQQPLGVKTEPYRIEESARHLRHGSALVAAGVMRCVDPLEVGCPAIDLDVRETARLGMKRFTRRAA